MHYVSYDSNNPLDQKAFAEANKAAAEALEHAKADAAKTGQQLSMQTIEQIEGVAFVRTFQSIAGHC